MNKKFTPEQKEALAARLRAGKERADEDRINKKVQERTAGLLDEMNELKKQMNDLLAFQTNGGDTAQEILKLRQELATAKKELYDNGALRKNQSTKPWHSIKKPFHKDIFVTKNNHKGFELSFISEHELDDYLSNGYNVAKGEDYGEKAGPLRRKRMLAVERRTEAAEEDRAILREFNLAQRTSALQDTKRLGDKFKRDAQDDNFTYEIDKETISNQANL
jgi:hypothetical protein